MTHEFDGAKYATASAHQKEWGAGLIAELALEGHERVLDLGCGDGALTARISDLLPSGEIVGVDASRGMIAAAQVNARPNMQLLVMDIDDLQLSNGFDVIFSNAALHWLKDHRRLYRALKPLLREHGRLRFNFAGDGNCANFISVVREAMALDRFVGSFADFEWPWYMPSVEEYSELVGDSALRHPRVWEENADRFFPDVDAMVGWLDQPSLVPFLAQIPDGLAESFREFVVGRMIDITRQPDGTCFETFRRINVSALG
jgi:trans-aconitate methyltransferase